MTTIPSFPPRSDPFRRREFACVVLVLLALSFGSAQSQESQSKIDPYRVGVEVDLITVPVTVRKLGEGYLQGLLQSAFHIYEDGVEQKIATFARGDLPMRVALLIDVSASVHPDWPATRSATRSFAENLKPDDRVAIVTFNTEIRLKMDWGREARKIESILDRVCCSGETRLWDAIWVVCTDLMGTIRGRKVVVILTDGLDNDSGTPFHGMVDAAIRSDATLYVVSKTQAVRKAARRMAGISEEDLLKADIDLRTLAYETGGRVLSQQLPGELENIYGQIEEELRNQYILGFVSSNEAKDESYRKLRIEVDRPGAVITVRPGYYAPSSNRPSTKK